MSNPLNRRQFAARAVAATGAMAAGVHAPGILKAADDDNDKWADLVGRFVYDGEPPERKKLKVDKDVQVCGKYDIRDESLMVGEGGGLANVYVYVRSRNVDVCPEIEKSVEPRVLLENRDCIFIPHCLKIWCSEQEFYTTNSQPIADNVAFSPLGDAPANIVLPPAPSPDELTSATWRFHRRQTVPVPILCNYHPWESAYILPLDHPYVDISKTDGTFRIPKLPVGELDFQVWHERVGYLDVPPWPKGRFTMKIKPGVNDLGMVRLVPTLFAIGNGSAR